MELPEPKDQEGCERVLCRMARGLRIAIILTFYFSLCVLIILAIVGAA